MISMNNRNPGCAAAERKNERGAALLMSLIVATILLAAGGALILTTAMTAKTAINSTSETQAYYGAEAGLQAALNALRGNDAPTSATMPAGMTGISFRNAVIPGSSNDSPNGTGGDPSTAAGIARLSRWLPYSDTRAANTRVVVGSNPTVEYSVVVSLPPGDILPPAPAEPNRLRIQATGYAPGGAVKRLQLIVARNAFDPTAPAMMTLVGSPAGAPAMNFDSGNSAKHVYSGDDHASSPLATLPAFGVTNPIDQAIANDSAGSNTTSTPAIGLLTNANLPTYLRSPAAARAFLDTMQKAAIDGDAAGTATYLPSGGSGTPTGFTFCKGDYTMGPGSGSGLLIVTGNLTTNGSTSFDGIVIALGEGSVNRNGGGGGAFYGATFIAAVDWPVAAGATPSPNFGAPSFNFNGAGNATMQYDSDAIANAMKNLPFPVLGVSEY